jgi:lon-related putative ATP-dependent protease
MAAKKSDRTVDIQQLRWRLDPKSLPFKSTDDLEPLDEIIGQERGVEAFRFGMGMLRKGYNIFVTGEPGTGRMATVKSLLKELAGEGDVPDDLCYVHNFKRNEEPVLLRFDAGKGSEFRKDMNDFLENVKREVPQLFESQEYVRRKNEIAEAHEKKIMEFYKSVEKKVEDTGLVVVKMQMGPYSRPDVVPLVDDEPKRMLEVEEMVEKGRFPRDEFERLKEKRREVKEEIDHIVSKIKDLQKELAKKHEEVDRAMLTNLCEEYMKPLRENYPQDKVQEHLDAVLEDMAENIDKLKMLGGQQQQGQQGQNPLMMMTPPPEVLLHDYKVNLLVDNAEEDGPPVIFESYPTYRNLFGSIERIMDRSGGYRTDFTKIKAGSFVRANGGYLVINLMDAIMEPGVWQTLKRSLKTEEIEIETYDPYYFITATGLKPEPIRMEVKVVVLADPFLYRLLRHYDHDVEKIFKVRADYESTMDRDEDAVQKVAAFIRAEADREDYKAFDASAVAALVEESVRWTGRQEKLSTYFPHLSDLLGEAHYFAGRNGGKQVSGEHVRQALEARRKRLNRIEERIQEMIDRGSIFVDTEGEVTGQVNGLAVYSLGDYAFGKPSRITATTSMGKEGIINIEREADLAGPIHNKGMLILAGYLRRKFAQNKPLSLAASIAFEQSYGGVDGDSASSTELYALLSSLSGVPIRQGVAVTGSVNQNGEVQPIGGVNEKIEGFYMCCKHVGLTGDQGVMIPQANVKDLMLREDVIQAVKDKRFTIWAVETVDQGIEILTGTKAGTRNKDGSYTKNSINALADEKLRTLAEGLRDWGKTGEEEKSGGKKK